MGLFLRIRHVSIRHILHWKLMILYMSHLCRPLRVNKVMFFCSFLSQFFYVMCFYVIRSCLVSFCLVMSCHTCVQLSYPPSCVHIPPCFLVSSARFMCSLAFHISPFLISLGTCVWITDWLLNASDFGLTAASCLIPHDTTPRDRIRLILTLPLCLPSIALIEYLHLLIDYVICLMTPYLSLIIKLYGLSCF